MSETFPTVDLLTAEPGSLLTIETERSVYMLQVGDESLVEADSVYGIETVHGGFEDMILVEPHHPDSFTAQMLNDFAARGLRISRFVNPGQRVYFFGDNYYIANDNMCTSRVERITVS